MNLEPAGAGRLRIVIVVLAVLAALAWRTMEPGKYRALTMVLLGFFAARSVMGFFQVRRRENELEK